jgi:hypothetical protein
MQINYTKSAIIDLQSLPKAIQKRIAIKMRFYADADNPLRLVPQERFLVPQERFLRITAKGQKKSPERDVRLGLFVFFSIWAPRMPWEIPRPSQ